MKDWKLRSLLVRMEEDIEMHLFTEPMQFDTVSINERRAVLSLANIIRGIREELEDIFINAEIEKENIPETTKQFHEGIQESQEKDNLES